METPIYNSTKQSFENIENRIDYINNQIDLKVNEAIRSGREYTKKEVAELKKFFEEQINSLKELMTNETESQSSKLNTLLKKIEPIKNLLQTLSNPPSIDTIVEWAKAAADLYTMQYEETIGRAADITMTITYVSTETPKVLAQITRLPQALDKLNSIPTK